MDHPRSTPLWGALTLVAYAALFAGVASAHVHVTCNPSHNKVKMWWSYPCSDTPDQRYTRDTTVVRNPPNPPDDVCLVVTDQQPNPPTFANRVTLAGCCEGGDPSTTTVAQGCAEAGRLSAQDADEPWASVGSGTNPSDPASRMRIHVERTVVPGPAPDLVTVTFVNGIMQTHTSQPGDLTYSTVKLIVYANSAAADADSAALSGNGSVFYGAATLVGATGTIVPTQGFSTGDFLVTNPVGSDFTAITVAGLAKTALVPDANVAVVSLVGDPKAYPASTVGVGGGDGPKVLGLALPRPNPSGRSVSFRFSLPRPGPVSLELFDLTGRRIRGWSWTDLPSGEHSVAWDGRTESGDRAPAGALVLRMKALGQSVQQKVTRLP